MRATPRIRAKSSSSPATFRRSSVLLALSVPLLASCVGLGRIDEISVRPHLAAAFEEAGSVHIAVLNSAPLARISTQLQPKFAINEEKALEEVIPNTQVFMDRVLDVVERSLRVTTPQTTKTETETYHSETGQDPTTKVDRTESQQPGAVPGAAPIPGGARTAAAIPAGAVAALGERTIDPFSRYRAATALLQEIRLLNQYVVAHHIPDDVSAQIVRLQVSVLPFARHQPYDVYTNITFFPEGNNDGTGSPLLSLAEPTAAGAAGIAAAGIAVVIPLLATDNFEASSQSVGAEAVQQAALSLLGLVKGFGIGADYGRLMDQLRTVSGRELNALFTTARLTDNTLRVRLGASFNSRSGYTMVAQTHNVSALVLLPKKTQSVRVVGRSTLRHATTGKALPFRTRDQLLEQACATLAGYQELPGNPLHGVTSGEAAMKLCRPDKKVGSKRDDVLKLVQFVEAGQVTDFEKDLLENARKEIYRSAVAALWSSLSETVTGSHFSRASFRVESTQPVWPGQQTVLATDNGKTITAVVAGGRDLPPNGYSATLDLPIKNGTKQVRAATIGVSEGLSSILLTFPSPKLLGAEIDASQMATLKIQESGTDQIQTWPSASHVANRTAQFDLVLQPPPKAEPIPSLSISVRALTVDQRGVASVQYLLRDAKKDSELYLTVSGADVTGVVPATALKPGGKGLKIDEKLTDTVKLTLANVHESSDVVLGLVDKEGKPVGESIRLDIRPSVPARQGSSAGGPPSG